MLLAHAHAHAHAQVYPRASRLTEARVRGGRSWVGALRPRMQGAHVHAHEHLACAGAELQPKSVRLGLVLP